MDDIAKHYAKDRTTIWRWLRAVENEAREQLEEHNIITAMLRRFEDLEDGAGKDLTTQNPTEQGIYTEQSKESTPNRSPASIAGSSRPALLGRIPGTSPRPDLPGDYESSPSENEEGIGFEYVRKQRRGNSEVGCGNATKTI